MIINPIYQREAMISQRNIRFSFFVLIFNLILELVMFIYIEQIMEVVRIESKTRYTVFLDAFFVVAIVELLLLLLFLPTITAGSISGEKERHTLELMLTTLLTPRDIVIGKTLSAFANAALLVFSAAPILCTVFFYGGITVGEVMMLFLTYFISIFFVCSIGIFFSSLFKKSIVAMAGTYAVVIVCILGLFMLRLYLDGFFSVGSTGDDFGEMPLFFADRGRIFFVFSRFMLFNPLVVFFAVASSITGHTQMAERILGISESGSCSQLLHPIMISGMIIPVVLGMLFLALAIWLISPRRRRHVVSS